MRVWTPRNKAKKDMKAMQKPNDLSFDTKTTFRKRLTLCAIQKTEGRGARQPYEVR